MATPAWNPAQSGLRWERERSGEERARGLRCRTMLPKPEASKARRGFAGRQKPGTHGLRARGPRRRMVPRQREPCGRTSPPAGRKAGAASVRSGPPERACRRSLELPKPGKCPAERLGMAMGPWREWAPLPMSPWGLADKWERLETMERTERLAHSERRFPAAGQEPMPPGGKARRRLTAEA